VSPHTPDLKVGLRTHTPDLKVGPTYSDLMVGPTYGLPHHTRELVIRAVLA